MKINVLPTKGGKLNIMTKLIIVASMLTLIQLITTLVMS